MCNATRTGQATGLKSRTGGLSCEFGSIRSGNVAATNLHFSTRFAKVLTQMQAFTIPSRASATSCRQHPQGAAMRCTGACSAGEGRECACALASTRLVYRRLAAPLALFGIVVLAFLLYRIL